MDIAVAHDQVGNICVFQGHCQTYSVGGGGAFQSSGVYVPNAEAGDRGIRASFWVKYYINEHDIISVGGK